MSNFEDDTTGMQNPIFKIMNNQSQTSNNGQQNQIGGQNMQNPMGQQMNMQNPMGQQMNQMNQSGMNQMNMNNMGIGMNNHMGQQMNMNMNPQIMMNNGMGMNNPQMMMNTGMGMNNPQMMMNMMTMNQMSQMNNMANINQQAMNMMNPNNFIANNNQSNNKATNNNGEINVFFRASGEGQKKDAIQIQCMLNDKVSDIIEKYKNKAGVVGTGKKFIFNAKNLVPSLTLAEAGITNNANIFVVETKGIKGANMYN